MKKIKPGNYRELYEVGAPITDIASSVGRSYTAVLQRGWEKGWYRQCSYPKEAVTEFSNIKQNPEVSKRINYGLLYGGQVK